MALFPLLDLTAGLLFIYFARKLLTRDRKPSHLPPGPKPVPLLGNIHDISKDQPWLGADKWAQAYGGITHLHFLGQSLIFINDADVANDLLEKRGLYYSNKPHFIMIGDLIGSQDLLPFCPYNDQYKRQRKLFNAGLGPQSIPTYHNLMKTKVRRLLKDLCSKPEEYFGTLRIYAGGLTLAIVYGYEPEDANDAYLRLAEECIDIFAKDIASNGGIWPVDVFPFMMHIPSWMPGGGFKTKAKQWRAKMTEFTEVPYAWAKKAYLDGVAEHSFCSTVLEQSEEGQDVDFDLKWVANSMYGASADTTITTLSHFLLAMIQYPEAMRKAQAEIDSVVGSDRLPDFSDRPSLPFVEAVYKEALRWGVPAPLGLPHSTSLQEDDVYRGYRIPKGSLIFANIWSMLRNEAIFPKAHEFVPERYLEKVTPQVASLRDPRNYVFGFGRRICPGMHFVDDSIWLVIANALATLDFSKRKDTDGNMIEPKVEFLNPVFRTPSPFEFHVQARSPIASDLFQD